MSMPALGEASDGLQPVRLFNRMAVEEKGEGARLVRILSSNFESHLSCANADDCLYRPSLLALLRLEIL